jgi:hypothetical protein
MRWSDDSGVWLAEQAAVQRLVQRLLAAAAEENAECPRPQEQKSPQQRVRVGRDSERVAAAVLNRRRKKERADSRPPVADDFRS